MARSGPSVAELIAQRRLEMDAAEQPPPQDPRESFLAEVVKSLLRGTYNAATDPYEAIGSLLHSSPAAPWTQDPGADYAMPEPWEPLYTRAEDRWPSLAKGEGFGASVADLIGSVGVPGPEDILRLGTILPAAAGIVKPMLKTPTKQISAVDAARTPTGELAEWLGRDVDYDFPFEERFPAFTDQQTELLERARKKITKEGPSPFAYNPTVRKTAAEYTINPNLSVADVRQRVLTGLNRDEEGLTIFDKMYDYEMEGRASDIGRKTTGGRDFHPYQTESVGVSPTGSVGRNAKTSGKGKAAREGQIRDMDTSIGCGNNCSQCYACGQARQSGTIFALPRPVELTGRFETDPKILRRIGTAGEPSIDPMLWQQKGYDEKFKMASEAGLIKTSEDFDRLFGDSYSWEWTNSQLRKTGLDADTVVDVDGVPVRGADRTYVITKLNTVEGFDPQVVRNLEVSLDPMNPHHYFRALENVEKLKAMDPTLNIWLRVRSLDTYSDEINALQKIAADFSNRHNIPILETRMRIKGGKQAVADLQLNPEGYTFVGNQVVPRSKVFKPGPSTVRTGVDTGGRKNARVFDLTVASEEEGFVPLPDYKGRITVRGAFQGKTQPDATKEHWAVYIDNKRVSKPMDKNGATAQAGKTLETIYPDWREELGAPSNARIREIARNDSPLSEFGANRIFECDELHTGSCADCTMCERFVREGARAWRGE